MADTLVALARRLANLGNQCTFRIVRGPVRQELSKENVRLLDNASKKHLLRNCIPFPPRQKQATAARLSRLQSFAPSTAQLFAPKSDDVTELKLRLYNERSLDAPGVQSYVCLSYRWPTVRGAPRRTPESDMTYELPTLPVMFQAVLEELHPLIEGLWLDQICIDQDDEAERTVTVGAMDLIYRSARAVIVALDDIEISRAEATVLKSHLHDPHGLISASSSRGREMGRSPIHGPGRVLHRLVERIGKSEYFERARCQHELRLGRDHIFLVRCRHSDVPGSCSVLRFTGSFLYFIFLLYARDSPADFNYSGSRRYVHSVFLKLHKDGLGNDRVQCQKTRMAKPFESYVHTMAEVYGNKAGGNPLLPTQELREYSANLDKMSIILNTVESGLVLRQTQINVGDHHHPATLHECYKHTMLTALAAGDPVALCTTGEHLIPHEGWTSWLCWPHSGALDKKHFLPMLPLSASAPISVDTSPACRFVELDLLFIGLANARESMSSSTLQVHFEVAKGFLEECAQHNMRDPAPYWISWRKASEAQDTYYVNSRARTLAHAFRCGLDWFIQLSECSGTRGRTAMHEALTCLFNETFQRRRHRWWETADGPRSATTLLELLDTIIGNNLRSSSGGWWPFSFTSPSGQRLLAFGPPDAAVQLAIPMALRADEYDFLARCWLLHARGGATASSEWTLLGKTRPFGVVSFAEGDLQRWDERRQQRVYGPDVGSGP